MVGVSRLLLPLVVNEFHVLGTLWQEIDRYWQRRDRSSTADRQHRTNSIEITRRNSCGIATAARTDTPACRYLLGSCHSEFQGVGPVCHKWSTRPKPWPKRNKKINVGYLQCYTRIVSGYYYCVHKVSQVNGK